MRAARRRATAGLLLAGLMPWLPAAARPGTAARSSGWPLWERYAAEVMQADGRIIEFGREARTTSEGQAYALFFALVADDRPRFDTLLQWTLTNLWADRAVPPAWLWGKRDDGSWGVLDANSASDADLWMVYALAEAARLWDRADYRELAGALLATVKANEIATADDGSHLLLPGRLGFQPVAGTYILNPSYAPPQLLARLTTFDPGGPWRSVAASQMAQMAASTPKGFAPDWWRRDERGGYGVEPSKGPNGSYDAIRNYLWAGMLDRSDPVFRALGHALRGMTQAVLRDGEVPHFVNVESGAVQPGAPAGFAAAVYPFLAVHGERAAAARLLAATQARFTADWHACSYYDKNLALFGLGWAQARYRFAADGTLRPAWQAPKP